MANLAIIAGPGITTTHNATVTPGSQTQLVEPQLVQPLVPQATNMSMTPVTPIGSGVIGGDSFGNVSAPTTLNGVIGGGPFGNVSAPTMLNGVIGGGPFGNVSAPTMLNGVIGGDTFGNFDVSTMLNGVIGGDTFGNIDVSTMLNGVIGGGDGLGVSLSGGVLDPNTTVGLSTGTAQGAQSNAATTLAAAAAAATMTIGMIGALGQNTNNDPQRQAEEDQPAAQAVVPGSSAQPPAPPGLNSQPAGDVN